MIAASNPARPIHWSLLLGFALLVTLFLFFIDEGNYTLRGIEEPGNIVAMSLYFLGLTVGLFATNAWLAKRRPGIGRNALVLALGSIAGVAITVLFFYCIRGFSLPS